MVTCANIHVTVIAGREYCGPAASLALCTLPTESGPLLAVMRRKRSPGVGICFWHVHGIDLQIHFREATVVMSKSAILLSISVSSSIVAFGLLAQQTATEAPAGFDTPTLQFPNAGSQSSSNGIAEPPGDTYALDQQIFERREDPSLG